MFFLSESQTIYLNFEVQYIYIEQFGQKIQRKTLFHLKKSNDITNGNKIILNLQFLVCVEDPSTLNKPNLAALSDKPLKPSPHSFSALCD